MPWRDSEAPTQTPTPTDNSDEPTPRAPESADERDKQGNAIGAGWAGSRTVMRPGPALTRSSRAENEDQSVAEQKQFGQAAAFDDYRTSLPPYLLYCASGKPVTKDAHVGAWPSAPANSNSKSKSKTHPARSQKGPDSGGCAVGFACQTGLNVAGVGDRSSDRYLKPFGGRVSSVVCTQP